MHNKSINTLKHEVCLDKQENNLARMQVDGESEGLIRKISLSELGHNLIDEEIEVSILPQTISERKAIPTEVCFECTCGYFDVKEISPVEFLQNEIKLCKKAKCPSCGKNKLWSYFSHFSNCYVIQAIHPLKDMRMDVTHEINEQVKIIEESRTNKPVTTYYITESNDDVTFGVLKAKGILSIDTKKKPFKYFLVVDEIIPEKDYFLNYDITKKDRQDFKRYFTDNNSLESDISDTISPNIIGRDLPKFFTALTQHSVLYIRNDTLGILSGLFVGDSRCGKTEIILDSIFHLSPLGCEYATAETATRTGISYTIKQVADSWEIEWGILPLCDKMLVGLDGLHAWGLEEIMQLREVRSQGFIRVRRSVKADSPSRVRILAAANLGNKISTYPTRWHSTWDSIILNHVDRNRWDFIFVFGETDINKAEINRRHRKYKQGKIKRRIPPDVWRKHIIWAWQLTPNRIKITKGTYQKIECIVNQIHDEFRESKIKPFTNEFFNTFEKMTVAYACLCHSVDERNNLVVKPEHTEIIYEKIKEYMEHLELEKARLTESYIPLDVLELLLSELKDSNKEKILLFIGNNRGCKQIDIANHLKVNKSYISKELDWFQTNQLIDGRTKIHLTENGAELHRKLLNELMDAEQERKKLKVDSINLSTNVSGEIAESKSGDPQVDKKVDSTIQSIILETMNKHPAKEWHYDEIAQEMGASASKTKEIFNFLKAITANPNNKTLIRRARNKDCFHLIKLQDNGGCV